MNGLTLVALVAILVSSTWAAAGGAATTTYAYVVPGSTVPGLTTGLAVDPATNVTITATGAICPYGSSFCPGPNGDESWNTTGILNGGFPLPGAPAWGLLARVGNGPWVHVGGGPTTITGTGVLEFAVNDDFLPDNVGAFNVTVTVSASTTTATCKPGWGYGDKNHEHCGPPGQVKKGESGNGGSDAKKGSGKEKEQSGGSGNSNGNGKGRPGK